MDDTLDIYREELRLANDRIERLEAALRWLVNLHHGVTKAGDGAPVSVAEWQDALATARRALDEEDTDG